MKAAADSRWVLLPGNHDPARADGLWSRLVGEAPETVIVCLEPQPIELAEGYWLLPAPLQYKRTQDDPTTWFDHHEQPDGAKQIGLAHGSIPTFELSAPPAHIRATPQPETQRERKRDG